MKKTSIFALMIAATLSMTCIAGAASTAEATSIDNATTVSPRAAAYWSTEEIEVPGTNQSGYTAGVNTKQTDTKRASFKVSKRSKDANMDARLLNSDNASRSSWARDLPTGSVVTVTSTATKNHEYSCQVSSDLLSWGDCTLTINWSADPMS